LSIISRTEQEITHVIGKEEATGENGQAQAQKALQNEPTQDKIDFSSRPRKLFLGLSSFSLLVNFLL
jgi:hypothetical protein